MALDANQKEFVWYEIERCVSLYVHYMCIIKYNISIFIIMFNR